MITTLSKTLVAEGRPKKWNEFRMPIPIRLLQQQILNYSRVSPCQQIIEIGKFFVEQIVFFGTNKDDISRQAGRMLDFIGELLDSVL